AAIGGPDDDRSRQSGRIASRGERRRSRRHPRQPSLPRLPQRSCRLLDEVPGGLGAVRKRQGRRLSRQEQHRSHRRRKRPGPLGRDDRAGVPASERRPCRVGATADATRWALRVQSRLQHRERPERGHREARDAHRRPLLPRARRSPRCRRSRHTGRRRQRRCLPVDDRELPVEVASLYREPERRDEIAFGALEFHDVFKIFRAGGAETVALRGLDLRVEPGELVAILGPSGSGKSTLLHLAAALDEPSAGDVRAFGRSLPRLDEGERAGYRARELAIVFQSSNSWPELSARENVVLSLRLAGRDSAAADGALAAFGLARAAGRRAGALSGGEQQRLAIAAAAARQAALVLADEPTAELDESNERAVLQALGRLRNENGATVVLVTHSPRVAEAADRVVELRDGRAV